MKAMNINVDNTSRIASEVGLENGVYNTMIYDSMVCRRGIWRVEGFTKFIHKNLKVLREDKLDYDMNKALDSFLSVLLCFFPSTGIQVDYTAGLIIQEETIPDKAKEWVSRMDKSWPSQSLKDEVMKRGAHLVPKVFKNAANQRESRARQWRINFDLNLILFDPNYSKNIDIRRVLIILKDIKNSFHTSLMKSYHIKVVMAIVMYNVQEIRDNLTNDDIIFLVLDKLMNAYKGGKLNDFFDPQFNHLHSNADKKMTSSCLVKELTNSLKILMKIFLFYGKDKNSSKKLKRN